MKKLLIILAGLTASGLGYHLYSKSKKKEELDIPKERELKNDNDYVIYHDDEDGISPTEETFV